MGDNIVTYAKVIADSISPAGDRITTFEVRFHRFVLAEFNTHRVFSRNSASSRAIPVAKQLERVENDPAFPVSWPAEQKGMQGGEELDEKQRARVEWLWKQAAEDAITSATVLSGMGLHKSVTNRLLEPFMWHTVVVTGTAWINFFRQRCSPLAQPEIRVVAEMMRDAYDASVPDKLEEWGWHLPYIYDEEVEGVGDMLGKDALDTLVKMSAARCARVSYLTQDGKRDIQADLALYNRLVTADPMHASPLEHVATPEADNKHLVNIAPSGKPPVMVLLPKYGNVLGWRQHRFDVEADLSYGSYS